MQLQEFPLDCSKFIICYKDYTISKTLDIIFLFSISGLLMLGMWLVNNTLKKRIKQDKNLRKKYYEDN
jgi:hypothetical protein